MPEVLTIIKLAEVGKTVAEMTDTEARPGMTLAGDISHPIPTTIAAGTAETGHIMTTAGTELAHAPLTTAEVAETIVRGAQVPTEEAVRTANSTFLADMEPTSLMCRLFCSLMFIASSRLG